MGKPMIITLFFFAFSIAIDALILSPLRTERFYYNSRFIYYHLLFRGLSCPLLIQNIRFCFTAIKCYRKGAHTSSHQKNGINIQSHLNYLVELDANCRLICKSVSFFLIFCSILNHFFSIHPFDANASAQLANDWDQINSFKQKRKKNIKRAGATQRK